MEFVSKIVKGYLIINWKTGRISVRKTKPKKVGNFDIPIKLEINLKIPVKKEAVAKGEITIPQEKVEEIAIGYLEGEDEDGGGT